MGNRILERHDFIDMVCFLEAERSFPELVDRLERSPAGSGGRASSSCASR